jgi:crotonobetainyl-CoA:carnitine CoA-transferase CaiB-like acyl-CoA transferase
MHKPLEGIRILEWGIFHAGPGGTAILSDMGAEVIKIEQPGTGDPSRELLKYSNINLELPNGESLAYLGSNRGKTSITLDLSHPEGKQIAYNLVKKSDVFFTNLRRSTIASMNMDYASLSRINPRLIYASVTGYGCKGADADSGAFDTQGQGRSGMMYNMGEPGMPPLIAQWAVVDQTTAIMASYQVVIALLMRERLGIGQEVDVSLLGTASYILYFNNLFCLLTGREVSRHEQASADPLRNLYRCQDDKWIVQCQPAGEERWQAVCQVLGHPELSENPRYNTRQKRIDNSKELVPIFNKAFLAKPRDEWLRIFREKKLVMCAVNTTAEAINDSQMIENDYIVDFEHPDMGHVRIPGFPIHFSEAEVNNTIIAPKLGQHTDSVLREIGGYSDAEITRFRNDKVI